VLASVSIDEPTAASLLGMPSGEEHHSVATLKSGAGQKRTLEVLSAPELQTGTVKIAAMNKGSPID
jgi:hypothetical protein